VGDALAFLFFRASVVTANVIRVANSNSGRIRNDGNSGIGSGEGVAVGDAEGIGVAEAPRGTLIHHYKVDPLGMMTWANMIIATEHNNIAYNKAITQVAKKYVKAKQLNEGMLNRVEAVIRAFDPCLSCATHAVGQMALDVRLID